MKLFFRFILFVIKIPYYVLRFVSWFIWDMTKFSLKLVVIFLVLLIVLIMSSDYIAKFAINRSASYLELNARVEGVTIHIFTQKVILENLTVKNPQGFLDKESVFVSRIEASFDVFNKYPLKRIYIQNPNIKLEGKFGKRILGQSLHRSNFFVIMREFLSIWSIDLDEMLVGKSEDFFTRLETIESKAKDIKYFGELRIDNAHIENGMKDRFDIGSIILHDDTFTILDMRADVCDVETSMSKGIFDIKENKIGFTNFRVNNPKGYVGQKAVEVGKFMLYIDEKVDEGGKKVLSLKDFEIESPTIYLEDKEGSMLGGFGIRNNLVTISDNIAVITDININNVFQNEFEGIEEEHEIKLPELHIGKFFVNNLRILSTKRDGGMMIKCVDVDDDYIGMKDLRVHLGGIKLITEEVDLDIKKEMLTIKNLGILNPPSFPEENAFYFGKIVVPTESKEENIRGFRVSTIESLEVSDYFVRVDSKSGDLIDLLSTTNNLFALIDAVNGLNKKLPNYNEVVKQDIDEVNRVRPHKFIIKRVVFKGGEIRIGPRGYAMKFPLGDIVIENLGGDEKGIPADQIAGKLVNSIALKSMDSTKEHLAEALGVPILQPIIIFFTDIIEMFQ